MEGNALNIASPMLIHDFEAHEPCGAYTIQGHRRGGRGAICCQCHGLFHLERVPSCDFNALNGIVPLLLLALVYSRLNVDNIEIVRRSPA